MIINYYLVKQSQIKIKRSQYSIYKPKIMKHPFSLTRVLIVFLLAVPLVLCQIYHLAPTVSNQIQYIRLNSIQEIDEPKLKLNNIYKRQIYQINSSNNPSNNDSSPTHMFQACQQYAAQVDFEPVGYYELPMNDSAHQNNERDEESSSSIIYDYEVLKSQYKNIVDMTYYNHHIFTITSTGVINVYKVDKQLQHGIQLKKSIDAIIWQNLIDRRVQRLKQQIHKQTGKNDSAIEDQLKDQVPEYLKFHHIRKGYFQLMDQTQLMLFANGEVLIALDIRTLKASLLSQETQVQVIFGEVNQSEPEGNDQDNQDNDDQDNQDDQDDQDWQEIFTEDDDEDENQQDDQQEDDSEEDQDFSQFKFPLMNFTIRIRQKYQYLENFQSLTKIDETHFAVLDKLKGAIIYKLQKTTSSDLNPGFIYQIQKVQSITKDDFWYIYAWEQEMNLVDMKYSQEKELLLLLDYDKGVLTFVKNTIDNQQSPQQSLSFVLGFEGIFKKQCNLMQYSAESQSLYLSCNKIYRISLTNWPMVQEKTYEHPMINIREIFPIQSQNLVVFAGYSTFKLFYLDRLADYYQDEMLEKIIFHDGNQVVTANQDAIYVYNYEVNKPIILCETTDKQMIGQHYVMVKTMAECTGEEFKNQSTEDQKTHQQQDICVYSTYKTLIIWEQGQIPQTSMLIMFIAFSILSLILLFWILITKFRKWRARQYLNTLATATHTTLVQQGVQKTTTANDISSRENAQTGESINKVGESLTSDLQPQQKL